METGTLIAAVHVSPVITEPAACANCQAPQMGEYCHRCGQHFLEGRLTIRRLVMDFVVRKLGLEGGLMRTVVDLTVQPAAMIRAYVDGRRQRYTNPMAYLLLAAATYLFLGRAWADALAAGYEGGNTDLTGPEAEALLQVQMYMEAHPALATLVLCLFMAPALRLLFRKSTTIAESTVFAIYLSAHLLVMQMAINVGTILAGANVYRAMTGPVTWVPTLVLVFGAGRFFGTRFSSFLKFTVALGIAVSGSIILMGIAWVALSLASAAPAAV